MALFPLFSGPRSGRASPSAALATAVGGDRSAVDRPAVERAGSDRGAPLGSWEFSQGFSIGRSRRCELRIPTTKDTLTVSKRHVGVVPMAESVAVTLRAAGGDWTFARRRWVLFDMEPMNGTAVNGVEVGPGGTHELRDGDLVVLASAMRQSVQLTVRFSDRAYSSVTIKAVARSLAPSSLSGQADLRSDTPVTTAASVRTRSSTPAMELCRSPRHMEETPERSDAMSRDAANELMLAAPVSSKRSRGSTPEDVAPPARSARLRRSNNVQQQSDGVSQQRKRTRRGERAREAETQETQDVVPMQTLAHPLASPIAGANRIAQAPPTPKSEQERERFMLCPVCLDYFHASATLPCSHTFCGHCISSWFRTSLSCPECRDVVRALPVRNRALDDLVRRLVGDTDAYKSLTERRAQQQRESAMQRAPAPRSSIFGALSPSHRSYPRHQHQHQQSFSPGRSSDVFSRWSVDEKHALGAFLSTQFGEARVASCKGMGLTEQSIDRASVTELLIAAQNLLLDCSALRGVGDEGRQRLKIFLFYG